MRHSGERSRLFLDMQQHPEKYSDRQIENVMAEQDRPVDVEAQWKEFSRKHIDGKDMAPELRPRRTSMRWLHAVAAVVLVALGMLTVTKVSIVSEQDRFTDSLPVENKEARLDNDARVRGIAPVPGDKKPILIVNGQKMQNMEMLSLINPADVEKMLVYKDTENTATFAARYGSQARYGVVNVSLKEGRERGYADILGPNPDSAGIYIMADRMPQFPGGNVALDSYIRERLNCPPEIQETGTSWNVIVSFVIEKDGTLNSFRACGNVLRSMDNKACQDSVLNAICIEEALRVCRTMPRWAPGETRMGEGDRNVRVKYFLPIPFGGERVVRLRGGRPATAGR